MCFFAVSAQVLFPVVPQINFFIFMFHTKTHSHKHEVCHTPGAYGTGPNVLMQIEYAALSD